MPRAHWAVDNKLHWHLDVTFGEDDCRARKQNASENLSLLRKLALQIIAHTDDKLSKQKRMVSASMDSDYLKDLLKNMDSDAVTLPLYAIVFANESRTKFA